MNTWPYWPELAIVFGLATVGNIVLTAFAEQETKTRRLAKVLLGAGLGVGLSAACGRGWFLGFVGVILVAVAVIHGWWLPRQGVNGLTAEPRTRYRALRGWK